MKQFNINEIPYAIVAEFSVDNTLKEYILRIDDKVICTPEKANSMKGIFKEYLDTKLHTYEVSIYNDTDISANEDETFFAKATISFNIEEINIEIDGNLKMVIKDREGVILDSREYQHLQLQQDSRAGNNYCIYKNR